MKKAIIFLITTVAITTTYVKSQNPYWRGGGNTPAGTDGINNTNNIFGTLANFPIKVQSFGVNRMILDNGGTGLGAGRVSLGNNLPNNFAPQDRLHLHQMGPFNNDTYIRFTNSLTGSTNIDGFAIGNSSGILGPFGDAKLLQYEQAPIVMFAPNSGTNNLLPYEWFRLQNGAVFTPSANIPVHTTDGYIGLNRPNPRSHIEMLTPAINGGEEFFMAKHY